MTTEPNLPLEPPTGPPPELDAKLDESWAPDGPAKGIRVRVPIAVAVLAVVALLGVFGGAQLKSSNASATVATPAAGAGTRNRQFSGGPNGQRGGGTIGTVESVNGDTVTVKDQQGVTKTITLDANTTISKSTTGSVADITTGETIIVRGTANSDGSTTAQNVTIGNGAVGAFGAPGGGPGGRPADGSSSSSSQN